MLAAFYAQECNQRNFVCVFDDATQRNLVSVSQFLTMQKPDYGLYLGGDFGKGKTIMMYAVRRLINFCFDKGILTEVVPENWSPQFEIYQAVDLVQMAKEDRKEFKRVCSLNMLGIDDLGVEDKKVMDFGTVMEPMMRLFEHRYNRQYFTLVTSNSTPKAQAEKFGDRIADRLMEMFHVISFTNEGSYRRKNKLMNNQK